jgi:hypothetical protein
MGGPRDGRNQCFFELEQVRMKHGRLEAVSLGGGG